MPRPGYRTQAQKDRRHSSRGGKTRTERLREKINQKRRRLREKNLAELRFHTKPITNHVDGRGGDADDYAIYGIHKDGSEWVLTGLAATDSYETTSGTGRSQLSRIKVRGRYVMLSGRSGEVRPEDGLEIDRFDTKSDAMDSVSADGSERVEPGAYLISPKHDPRNRTSTVDKDAFHDFKHSARKVWE